MSTRLVNTHEAKSQLSQLIRDAENGIDVIVARNGKPVARIVPWSQDRPVRKPGAWSGSVSYHDDIVGPDPDVAVSFDESASADVIS